MSGARPRLRSLRTKLALVFFAIIVAAFGLLYFIVTPQLESNLEQRQLDDLRASARDVRPRLRRADRAPRTCARRSSTRASARSARPPTRA